MNTPSWWYQKNNVGLLLAPLSVIYRVVSTLRACVAAPHTLSIPVLCIGNVVAGGGGKTPVALAIGAWCKAQNINAFFVSRGYGGNVTNPTQVTPSHTANDVGDEPLLLAKTLPTVVGENRAAAIEYAATQGATLAILDDGFQNPHVQKTLSVLVLKGENPLGNARIIPAGPLREPLAAALNRAQAVVWVDAPAAHHLAISVPMFTATSSITLPAGVTNIVAFAGIARPELFRAALARAGAEIVVFKAFADHHAFSETELQPLFDAAKKAGATLATTEKDWVRLPPALQKKIAPIPLAMAFDNAVAFEAWLSEHLLLK